MLRLFFLRHGETDYNLKGIVQGGGVDSDLNLTGLKQANLFWDQYKNIPFAGTVCSGLKRTYQTIEPFREIYGEPLQLPDFDELNWGILEGMKPTPEMHKEYHRLNIEWQGGNLDAKVEAGESPNIAWNRLRNGIEHVKREFNSGNILICVHGRVLRIMLAEMLGYGMRHMNGFPHDNTGLNLLNLQASGKITADKLNDLSHLK